MLTLSLQAFQDAIQEKYKGRFRRDGVTPYFDHLEGTLQNAIMLGCTSITNQMLALAHDSLEVEKDGWVAYTKVEMRGLASTCLKSYYNSYDSETITEMVDGFMRDLLTLTKQKGESQKSYLARIKQGCNCGNPNLIRLKIADSLYNLADQPTDKQRLRYRDAIIFLRTK